MTNLSIHSIDDATYKARRKDSGRMKPVSDPEDYEGDIYDTEYSFTVSIDNPDSEPVTISEAYLLLDDVDENLRLSNSQGDEEWSNIRFGENDSKTQELFVRDDARAEYEETLEGKLRIRAVTGELEERIVFDYYEPSAAEDDDGFSWNDEE